MNEWGENQVCPAKLIKEEKTKLRIKATTIKYKNKNKNKDKRPSKMSSKAISPKNQLKLDRFFTKDEKKSSLETSVQGVYQTQDSNPIKESVKE